MRAFQVTSFETDPSVVDIPTPQPGPGEILLEIHACALNFADLLMLKGKYQDTPDLPFTPGLEVAGVVVGHGDGVTQPAIGTRVAVFGGRGGLAQTGVFSAALCVPLPDALDYATAAAIQVAYGTSHVALDKANLTAQDTLLVTGAAGGVGLTAVELGAKMGCRVIAAARGAEKLEIAKAHGATDLIDTRTEDLRDAVKALGGADVVYETVGGDSFTAALRACNPQARMIVIGFASGDIPTIPANILLVKNITVLGFYWGGHLKFAPTVLTDSIKTLFDMQAQGQIQPHISHRFTLDDTAKALETLSSRKSTGKVVVLTR